MCEFPPYDVTRVPLSPRHPAAPHLPQKGMGPLWESRGRGRRYLLQPLGRCPAPRRAPRGRTRVRMRPSSASFPPGAWPSGPGDGRKSISQVSLTLHVGRGCCGACLHLPPPGPRRAGPGSRPFPELPAAGAIRLPSVSCAEAARPPAPSMATSCGRCHRPHRGPPSGPASGFGPQPSPKPPSCASVPASNRQAPPRPSPPLPGQCPLPAAGSPPAPLHSPGRPAEMLWCQHRSQHPQSHTQHTCGSAMLSRDWDGTRRRGPRPAVGSLAGPSLPLPAPRRCPGLSPAAPGGSCPGSRWQRRLSGPRPAVVLLACPDGQGEVCWHHEKSFVLPSPAVAAPGRHGQGVPLPPAPLSPPCPTVTPGTVPSILPAASPGTGRCRTGGRGESGKGGDVPGTARSPRVPALTRGGQGEPEEQQRQEPARRGHAGGAAGAAAAPLRGSRICRR